MFSNILGGAAGFPVADLGQEISQSLRFSGSKLTGSTVSTSTWTCSFWIKFAVGDGSGYIFSAGNDAGVSTNGNQLYMNNDADSVRGRLSFDNGIEMANRRLRDPSAWYHIVGNYNGSVLNYWVNNQSLDTLSGVAGTGHSGTFVIGGTPDTPVASCWDAIYLAEFNYLDGTVLTPTSFGRTNDDGVWVPENLGSLTSDQYGADGFRLQFNDSSNLGDDSAPTGGNHSSANDFTPSGFDTADVALYSKDLSLTSGTEQSSNPFENAFDGSTSTFATCNESSGTFSFNPDPAISFSSSVQVRVNDSNATATIGSTTVNLTANSLTTVVSGSGSFGVGGDALVIANTTTNPQIEQIAVDGTVLVDNTNNDVDFQDTPTSNYATYNPIINNDPPTLGSANLAATGINNGLIWATQNLPNKHLYAEFIKYDDNADRFAAGVANANSGFERGSASDNDYAFMIVYSEWNGNNSIFNENTTATQTSLTDYVIGDVLGVEWRGDLATRQVNFYINGTQVGNSENVADGDDYYFAVQRAGGSNSPEVLANFGQMPFLAAPSGVTNTANGMQTNNLPEPTIKNGKEHFDVITYAGNNDQQREIDGLDFAPGLVWIKQRDGASTHSLQDTVRGAGANSLRPDTDNAEGAGAAANGFIDRFDDDGFRLNRGTDPGGRVNSNAADYVAWCWKAGGTAVSNTDGTITSSVSANTDAGFSIVSYTGTNANATVGHGLSSPPEMIIIKNRTDSANWIVYHKYVDSTAPEDYYLMLHVSDARTGDPDGFVFNGTAPTSSVFNVGAFNNTNGSGDNLIAYCWHSVEGFSKFGSYTGNSSTTADGPFIYTGFRPAWIMIKCSSINSTNWVIDDAARSIVNPVDLGLQANESAGESSSQSFRLDFLSNGFKVRSTGVGADVNRGNLIYAAFAENPFGGENAPPVTAR